MREKEVENIFSMFQMANSVFSYKKKKNSIANEVLAFPKLHQISSVWN